MKNKVCLMMALLSLALFATEGISHAQSDYKNMNRSERKHRMEELLYFNVNDMSISTDSAQFIKRDLQQFGREREKYNTKVWIWSMVGMTAGLGVACLGAVMEEPVSAVVGGTVCLVGIVAMTVNACDETAQKLYDKARLISDASVPLMQYDNLALGVGVMHNKQDHTNAFGPSLTIRF